MPWVRIDENALEHPKIGGLPDGAFRLWVQALAYCQKFLTDGYVPDHAVRSLLAYSPRRRAALERTGLWDAAESGIRVHDYLEWNDSRQDVLEKRDAAKERMRNAREKRSRELRANTGPCSPERSREVLRGVVCSEEKGTSKEREGGPGETDAVQRLVDRHRELYDQFLHVGYIGNARKDYEAACQIVRIFPDPAMQDAILAYGLNDADPFMAKDTRTITKIASRASKYAEELKAKKLA